MTTNSTNQLLKRLLSDYKVIVIIFVLLAIIVSTQSFLLGSKVYYKGAKEYTHYNNYKIFESSFHHLKEAQDLYILYPNEHYDLYKYSPTFSVFFGVFTIFPDWLGINLWNLFNVLVFLFAVYFLPKLSNYQKGIVLIISLIELITSLQSMQTNGLIAGLLILAFGLLEKDKLFLATLAIVLSIYIKLFGLVGFALFLFYPKKAKLALYSVFWLVILFAIPLIFIDFSQYMLQLSSWKNLLFNDHNASFGYSVMGLLHSFLSLFTTEVIFNKNLIVLIGVLVFLLPLIRIKQYSDFRFRLLTLSSILIWVIIFNHKAESPTFIIAIAGAALWFVISEKTTFNIILMVFAIILTSLSPTDIFPSVIRNEFIKPYSLKALPIVIIWIKLIVDMVKMQSSNGIEKGTE